MQDSDDSDSAIAKASDRSKKQRILKAPSKEPEGNEEAAIGKGAFTEKLQKFKKSPQKKVSCKRS